MYTVIYKNRFGDRKPLFNEDELTYFFNTIEDVKKNCKWLKEYSNLDLEFYENDTSEILKLISSEKLFEKVTDRKFKVLYYTTDPKDRDAVGGIDFVHSQEYYREFVSKDHAEQVIDFLLRSFPGAPYEIYERVSERTDPNDYDKVLADDAAEKILTDLRAYREKVA